MKNLCLIIFLTIPWLVFAQFDNYVSKYETTRKHFISTNGLHLLFRYGYGPVRYPETNTYFPMYEQYGNLFFFRSKSGGKNRIYNHLNYSPIETDIDTITSVILTERNELTVTGHSTSTGWMTDRGEWHRTINEELKVIHYAIDVPDLPIGTEILKNETEGQDVIFCIESAGAKDGKGDYLFLFKFFDEYVILDFSSYRGSHDGINVSAVYNTRYNIYFLFVEPVYRDYR